MSEQPYAELKTEACTVAAKVAVEVMNGDQTNAKQRLGAMGNYMLCCFLACDETEIKDWERRCIEGFVRVGVPEEAAEKLGQKYIKNENIQRIVVSLSYIADESIPGVIKRRKKTDIVDEIAFFRGVIERAQEGGAT